MSRNLGFPFFTALRRGFVFAALVLAASCAGSALRDPDVFDNELAVCPASPNCVNSQAEDEAHRIDSFQLAAPDQATWHAVIDHVRNQPRASVVVESDYYMAAEYHSLVFAFVDDLELLVRDDQTTVDVRSGSRIGYWDWGVNRRRVEELRDSLREAGLVR